jgi:hypothetical protein
MWCPCFLVGTGSERWGNAHWARSSRLSGATELHFFDTFQALHTWAHEHLRVRCEPGNAGLLFSGSTGSALATDGSIAMYTYTGLPVSILAPTPTSPQWALTVSRDRGEFPELQWKLLQADNRADFHHLLQLHGCTDEVVAAQAVVGRSSVQVAADRNADGDVLWQVQTVAAELCTGRYIENAHGPGEVMGGQSFAYGHEGVWTRWVAVLRSGRKPSIVAGMHTMVSQHSPHSAVPPHHSVPSAH